MKKKIIMPMVIALCLVSSFLAGRVEVNASQWIKDSVGWWLKEEAGYPRSEWRFLGGKWYFFNGDGYMVTGWRQVGSIWYYMDSSGAMVSNRWIGDYYLGSSGAMATNTWIGNYYVGDDGKWVRDADSMFKEAKVADIVNQVRMEHGLSQLTVDRQLTEAANVRARELERLFAHTRPNGSDCFSVLDEMGIGYVSAGENIATGYINPESVMNGWINSPPHYLNIIGDFTHIGVGHFKGNDGRNHWVQLFTHK